MNLKNICNFHQMHLDVVAFINKLLNLNLQDAFHL